MKKQSLLVGGVAAITILLSGCSILSGIPGLGPDPRCAAIENAFVDQIESDGSPYGAFEAVDIAKADLPGEAELPPATCSYHLMMDDDKGAEAYFVFYLTKDDSRFDTVDAVLTSAGFERGGGGGTHSWNSLTAGE